MSGFNLARYTINIYSPEVVPAEEGSAYKWDLADNRVLADLPAVMELVTEKIAEILPDGYTVKIEEAK